MKKLLTTKEIREKYSSDFVFENIQLTFEKNIDKLFLTYVAYRVNPW